MPPIGPFDAAETAHGRPRDLTEDEAPAVGPLDGSYRQSCRAARFERARLRIG